jgi:hypothetical protein
VGAAIHKKDLGRGIYSTNSVRTPWQGEGGGGGCLRSRGETSDIFGPADNYITGPVDGVTRDGRGPRVRRGRQPLGQSVCIGRERTTRGNQHDATEIAVAGVSNDRVDSESTSRRIDHNATQSRSAAPAVEVRTAEYLNAIPGVAYVCEHEVKCS